MQAVVELPEWVVCHEVTRDVSGVLVRCPSRGSVLSDDCLRCRFLTTSSVERSGGPWCEVMDEPPDPPIARLPARSELRPMGPGRAVMPAVRPPEPVPSGQSIGT